MAAQGAEDAVQTALPLIEAKLAVPRIHAGVVPRPRLFAVLDRGSDVELTLLSGPAGSGKSVLVSSWLTARPDLAVAWTTLDADDDDPTRLWTYVAHAVDRLRPGIARPALARLRTPRHRIETVIDELLNGLAGFEGRAVVVLDDLHHVRSERSLRPLVDALERLPPNARVVATTRSDPGRRLGRLRARRGLVELRAKELAFTVSEANDLLVEQAGIPVDRTDVELLVERTEGWPAGISLAALWLSGADTPAEGIRQFSADHRHVADYLTSEVLETLDDETRRFLLFTSIFDRFTAKLCDAVLDTDDSARTLTDLGRSNLFLIALDSRRVWYRYHHLFRELLRIELASESPQVAPELHRRAADWFLANGLIEEAIGHTAHTGDNEALARLLTATHGDLLRSGRVDVLLASLERLSEAELGRHPVLAAAGAISAGVLAHPATKRRRLAELAEANRHTLPEQQQLYVETLVLLTYGGLLDDDLERVLENAARAVELTRTVEDLAVAALASLAYAQYLRGELDAARATAEEAVRRPDAPQRPHGLVYAEALLALLECDAGHPQAAEARGRRAVAQARELGLTGVWSSALAHHALGQALLTLGRARDAERELERAETLRRAPEPRLDHAHTLLALASARIARGRLSLAAIELEGAREQMDAIGDAGCLDHLAAEVERQLDLARAGSSRVIEAPTLAELSVLRLLATELSQREIGGELFLSMNTVKTHTRSLYSKLGVNSRAEAVREANALGLTETTVSPG